MTDTFFYVPEAGESFDALVAQSAAGAVSLVQGDLDAHEARRDNPHGVTHAQTGPGQVDPVSTDTARDKHVSNADAKGWQDHKNSTSNPHGVTHAQTTPVGANPASTNATRDKHVSDADAKAWEDHRQRTDNPHSATAAQVGAAPSSHVGAGGAAHAGATQTAAGFASAADKTKLDGVEAGATQDQTAAEILAATKTVYGSASGLDADLLDGFEAAAFVRAVNGTGPDASGNVAVSGGGGAAIPAGVMHEYAGATAPSGYLLCDGAAVSRTTYAGLFAAVGTTYGAGDGSTTFGLPDMRGRVAVGAGQGTGLTSRTRGQQIGSETHTLDVTQIPGHTHSVPSGAGAASTIAGGGTRDNFTSPQTTGSTGGSQSHPNMQPSLVLNYIIKT